MRIGAPETFVMKRLPSSAARSSHVPVHPVVVVPAWKAIAVESGVNDG